MCIFALSNVFSSMCSQSNITACLNINLRVHAKKETEQGSGRGDGDGMRGDEIQGVSWGGGKRKTNVRGARS